MSCVGVNLAHIVLCFNLYTFYMSIRACWGLPLHKFQSRWQLGMQNEICCSSVIYLLMRAQRKTETERKRENLCILKLSMVKCQECGLFVACGHIYASWCHPTAVCLGGSTHTPTHRPSYSCSLQPLTVSLLSVLKYCQTLLALRPVLIVISISSSFHRAFYLPFPCRYLTFTQSFTGFTHLFTRHSNFFLFLCFVLYLSNHLLVKHSTILQFLNFSKNWLGELIDWPSVRWAWSCPRLFV